MPFSKDHCESGLGCRPRRTENAENLAMPARSTNTELAAAMAPKKLACAELGQQIGPSETGLTRGYLGTLALKFS
jgi:hypothetical protein